jgi:carboxypeptidase Taq
MAMAITPTAVSTSENMSDSRKRFYSWMATLHDLDGAVRLLDWDRETTMPARGAEARGRQVATLRALRHREVMREGIDDDLEAVAAEMDPDAPEQSMVRLARRERRRAERLSETLVREHSEAASRSVTTWLSAVRRGDFAAFAPTLDEVVGHTRRMGEALGMGNEAYDGLLDEYEPGFTARELETLFTEIVEELRPIVAKVPDGATDDNPFAGHDWPDRQQLRLAEEISRLVGFDMDAGMIALSAHPFTDSPHSGDVRFTTRLTANDPTGNVLVTLHEAGHGMYAQGHPVEFDRTLIYGSPSLGAEESQSRFFENHIGRHPAFWEHLLPTLRVLFPNSVNGLGAAVFHRQVARAVRHWCRVDADEVTYDLHIALRFRLEVALVRGELEVADLPVAWREGMQDLLGVTPANDAQGCMQDIHWAWGLIGYFPTYTLGNIHAAQLAEALEREHGTISDLISRGAFDVPIRFMRDRVHRHGSRYPTRELMERATGTPFSTEPLFTRIRRAARDLS